MKSISISPKWDQRFLELAGHVAAWSKDPSTKAGAVLVGRRRQQISLGYNGFPPGIEDTSERLNDRQTKYNLVVHAERNALYNADFDTEGGTMYVSPLPPCSDCAKSIITKGITRVVAIVPTEEQASRWGESFELMAKMFAETGIDLALVPLKRVVKEYFIGDGTATGRPAGRV